MLKSEPRRGSLIHPMTITSKNGDNASVEIVKGIIAVGNDERQEDWSE